MIKKKMLYIGYQILKYIAVLVAAVFILYGLLTLWDMFRTATSAFASYDLLKYRPNIEEDEPPYLDELIEINPDTAAWLTIYGTNIDYPVMQGKTDMEYINKNATGGFTPTGSIFLSVVNAKDFTDRYNLVYGHHMHNGAMFGDIDKFKDKKFFYNTGHCRFKEDEGVLIMEEKVYNLKVIGLVETDCYDESIYNVDANKQGFDLETFKAKSKYWRNNHATKILAMSTCDEEDRTGGRTILLCQMKKRTEPLPTREEEPLTPHRKAIGHPMAGSYWAFMNLVILIYTIYLLFPVRGWIKDKKKIRIPKKIKPDRETAVMYFIALAAIVLFFLTENPHQPIQIIDNYTIAQLSLFAALWYVRCRKERIPVRRKKVRSEKEN